MRPIHPAWVVLLTSAWLATACNLPLWQEVARLPGSGSLRDWGFALAFGAIVAAGNAALLSLLAWRWTLKPAAVVLVLMAALGMYFMLAYGIAIDSFMLLNVLQTDLGEARDLLDWRLPVSVLALAAPPFLGLYRRPLQRLGAMRQVAYNGLLLLGSLAVSVLCLLLVFQEFSSTMRNHPRLRYLINPLNSVYALGNIATQPLRMDTHALLPLGRDARLGASYSGQTKPPLLVLVLGETGRSQNFGINGYARDTTPRLAARKDLVSARNAWSCGTSTAASLPCMFAHLGRTDYGDRPANYENLLDVLQHAGLGVLWVENQSGCKGACARIGEIHNPADPALCPGGECLDRVMLQNLDAQIAALPAERRARGSVVVLHQMGSHGPAYYKRSAQENKKFEPECHSAALQECGREQVVNAYDNSIVETDHFLDSVLEWLLTHEKRAQTAMMYVADHGESLGENNIYLHGLPYAIAPDVQKHIPWITWLSPAMQARTGLSSACLQRDQDQRRISHDNYFHSVLGLMDVQTSAYRPELDLFAPCSRIGGKQG
ncbi:phosphoethanolamine--lipid A transferase [Verminephrobacter aporrectodeae subsp. tuberculatae]|uniref:phosphoethanolamine transferase n=1 Tax=Verminephrobacter aporrectodeae TaxID=1110389 RepID=UPI0022374FE7|nr:phosphoethanolamine--lipid A transferase [Verminephrobacter aporrectodeae]MCW5221030.1 phosphoethanolamine--lipid A transferase [Verminephrobacter aporrectodeae subsp. tuberculatae]MCW5290323.1 phosphoethanolamine--lipid A transferase [Verminephrobacter aporrectodeae subsp. tuberculatae]MCW8165225.1 phosphoethanolamine--lipid A transferase [Verminephrobacter aporrectodeae subsp. tuberculatae]MCW8167841.1 phosphoethanolamine--lipid A transferase [Verminephrobacter aporrectodeae subsp. tubercu